MHPQNFQAFLSQNFDFFRDETAHLLGFHSQLPRKNYQNDDLGPK